MLAMAEQQAVEHNAFMPRHSERLGAMAADIAGASGDQDTCHGGDVDEDEIGMFCKPGGKSGAARRILRMPAIKTLKYRAIFWVRFAKIGR
jgi:hypothetical protein